MQEKSYIIARKIPPSWQRQKIRLLILAGRRKSGKDVLLSYLLSNYRGFKHYRIAEAPVRIARVLELEPGRKVLHALFGVNAILYPLLGESAYKRRIAKMLDREKPRLALVEAIRTKEEYEEFVVKRKGLLIGITADSRIRYGRALADSKKNHEKRDEGEMSFREFITREYVPIEREIDWIVKKAHFVIENNYKNRAWFYKEIDAMMARLGFEKEG